MKTFVISLGGSLFAHNTIDASYIKKFADIIKPLSRNNRFIIVTGGGDVARNYINALDKIKSNETDKSWAGIRVTKLNAYLVSKYLKTNCPVPNKLSEIRSLTKKHKIVVCGGFKPNMTSDGDAADIAKIIKANMLINLTNVDGLYDKDPKLKGAKLIPQISLKDFLKIMKQIGHKAGQHFVLDLEAAKVCEKNNIQVSIINGKRLANLRKCLISKPFIGTVIY